MKTIHHIYQHLNGFAVNGAQNSPDAQDFTVNNDQVLKSQLMIRLRALEKQNAELKKNLEQSQNEVTEIIAVHKNNISVLAHDLKSPFCAIYGVLGILRDCIRENKYDQWVDYIDIASSYSLSTTNLIDNILAWVHSQNNEKQINPIRVNLASLVGQEIENSNLAVKLKKLSLRHSIPLRFVVRADIQASQSIIRNLISNAIKFTKPGGRITISAKEANSFIEIIVKDDGIGIPLTKQQDLFKNDPLELPSGSSNIKDKGLGLMLCKKFVEIQGGTIRVESRQDKGSRFIFTLPKYE